MNFNTTNEAIQYLSDLSNKRVRVATNNIPMPKRQLGVTGHNVSIFSLGGQGSLEQQGDKDNCIEIIRRAYDLGVNYFDTSPIYGPSEDYYGEALQGIRDQVFLATKTEKRDYDGSMRNIEESLKRLKTDYVDLWQIHHLESIEEAKLAKDGALKALIEMKEHGVVKNLGFTGHDHPDALLYMMDAYPFDTVLCPVNAAEVHMEPSFINDVVSEANRRRMGIIGMKIFSQGFIFHPDGITTTWEPIVYALSQNISTIIVGCDTVAQLEENVSIAKAFYKLHYGQQQEIERKTKDYLERSNFFRREFGGYDSQKELDPPYRMPKE
jgi:aryl-alcohol dehydrogenase-like predicted oxidoreductase